MTKKLSENTSLSFFDGHGIHETLVILVSNAHTTHGWVGNSAGGWDKIHEPGLDPGDPLVEFIWVLSDYYAAVSAHLKNEWEFSRSIHSFRAPKLDRGWGNSPYCFVEIIFTRFSSFSFSSLYVSTSDTTTYTIFGELNQGHRNSFQLGRWPTVSESDSVTCTPEGYNFGRLTTVRCYCVVVMCCHPANASLLSHTRWQSVNRSWLVHSFPENCHLDNRFIPALDALVSQTYAWILFRWDKQNQNEVYKSCKPARRSLVRFLHLAHTLLDAGSYTTAHTRQ